MRTQVLLPILAATAFVLSASILPLTAAIEDVRRLYDLTPVSTNNPVLASVKECQIEIPVSEYRAYINSAFIPGKEGKTLAPAEKRAKLDELLNEYFWVWQGYSQ